MKVHDKAAIMHLLQFTDSAFPVGSFSFSNGLETATAEGIVHDAATLETYVCAVLRQAAFSEGVVALLAYRAVCDNCYDEVCEVDRLLFASRMNDEARQMLCRMGKKLAELATHITISPLANRWLGDIQSGLTSGTYPVAQAILFAEVGLSDSELFYSHCYGVVNMVLSAALRCMKVSHYDTQRILFRIGDLAPRLFAEAQTMDREDINAFTPQMDILAALHEKGNMRMFMN